MPLTGEYVPSPRQGARDQVELYERTGGAEGNTRHGLPVIILTTLGARSGAIRKTPLMRVEHGGRYLVVGSQGGAPTDPRWVANIRAHPQVELQDGPSPQDMVAHEATGPERAEWWARAVEAFPPYADYQQKTDRLIPVFVLEPVSAT